MNWGQYLAKNVDVTMGSFMIIEFIVMIFVWRVLNILFTSVGLFRYPSFHMVSVFTVKGLSVFLSYTTTF